MDCNKLVSFSIMYSVYLEEEKGWTEQMNLLIFQSLYFFPFTRVKKFDQYFIFY